MLPYKGWLMQAPSCDFNMKLKRTYDKNVFKTPENVNLFILIAKNLEMTDKSFNIKVPD